ncbi:MAG: hypothetical protein R6U27_08710 [Desulfobacterales bacterium]
MNQIEFEVGGKYENMKGTYEVLSINDETMQIRWESGEEAVTEIDFQRRIIERMEFEQNQLEKKKAKKAKKVTAGGRIKFEGLKESDFSKKVSGTIWRRRSCLGGSVKIFSESDRFDIKSWSIARKPMIQWADVQHRNPDIFNYQGKFFVCLGEKKLYCGYCIEHSKKIEDNVGDWNRFVNWLMAESNEQHLKEMAFDRNLAVYNLNKDGEIVWKIHSTEKKWKLNKKGQEKVLDSLPEFLKKFSESSRRVDLQIAKSMDKEEVIGKGPDIADDISVVFESLFPLYEASVS